MTYPSVYGPIPVPDLENWNTDRSVDPPVMVRGNMYRTSAGEWYYASEDLPTTLNTLIETLIELNQRLAPLAGAMASTAQLRAVVTGAVTATGGGYITSAQMVTALLTQTTSLLSNQRLEMNNTLPTLANINNVEYV